MKAKQSILFILNTILLGAVTGLIIWVFLWIMNNGINLLWEVLPGKLNFPFYTMIVCTVGGILIGLFKRKFGDYPEELNAVLAKVKETGRYSYKDLFPMLGCALFPLLLGASIGPEAGLTGVIAGLCTWVGDRIKQMFNGMNDLAGIGISAALGTIFRSPMFGFIEPIEDDNETVLPKSSKIVLYFTAILSSFGIFILMNKLFGGSGGIEALGNAAIGKRELIFALPVCLLGVLGGYIYFGFERLMKSAIKPFGKNILLKCTFGGLLLGISGTFLPLTMFSGEHQIGEIISNGQAMGATMLILIAVVKLLLTGACIETGLKGGHFFPVIFSGICIGYALSLLMGIDSVFCMGVATVSLVAHMLKKPLATVLLLMILFPPSLVPVMLAAAVIACIITSLLRPPLL